MSWIPLNSTAIHAARYVQAESLLELEFCDGAIYRSCAVPEPTFQEFLQAESKGRYFNLHLRKKFVFDIVRPPASHRP
jgi:hypothetical protein